MALETILSVDEDNRFFANAIVGGKRVNALLDSGAAACCIGKNSPEFLSGLESQIVRFQGRQVQTANGGTSPVVGIINLPVIWKDGPGNWIF